MSPELSLPSPLNLEAVSGWAQQTQFQWGTEGLCWHKLRDQRRLWGCFYQTSESASPTPGFLASASSGAWEVDDTEVVGVSGGSDACLGSSNKEL